MSPRARQTQYHLVGCLCQYLLALLTRCVHVCVCVIEISKYRCISLQRFYECFYHTKWIFSCCALYNKLYRILVTVFK